MDVSNPKASPFPPASDVPLHRNPPLAPSQEMAYRNKCIQLKRRLMEIETNNDATRKRITNERDRLRKMRFLRAILLNQLKDVMSTTGRRLTPEQLSKLGIAELANIPDPHSQIEGDGLLDDSSDESDDEDIPEPSERPTRTRRNNNNNYRETIMSTTPGGAVSSTAYSQSGLPSLAPANSYSPAAARDTAPSTSSFHVASAPLAAASPVYTHHVNQQYPSREVGYSQQSSPMQQHHHLQSDALRQSSVTHDANGVDALVPPVRPEPPFSQFHSHMRPQLEADNYPTDQIDIRIEEEWKKLSDDNRMLWEQRYEDQMMDYQENMDIYNRARRRAIR